MTGATGAADTSPGRKGVLVGGEKGDRRKGVPVRPAKKARPVKGATGPPAEKRDRRRDQGYWADR